MRLLAFAVALFVRLPFPLSSPQAGPSNDEDAVFVEVLVDSGEGLLPLLECLQEVDGVEDREYHVHPLGPLESPLVLDSTINVGGCVWSLTQAMSGIAFMGSR